MFVKRYLKMTCVKTPCTFGDLFLLGRHVEEVTFFNGGYILYERGTVPVKMVYNWVRGWTMGRPGDFGHGEGVPPGSLNSDPISDQKLSFFTPVFRPVL